MQLFRHQADGYLMARQSIAQGKKRPIIGAPTAFGKTILAGYMLKQCQDKGKRGWFFCDRKKLVDQTIDKFTQMGINFGVHQASHPLTNPHAPIQIASIQTVQAMLNKHKRRLPEFEMAIVDECHVQYEIIDKIMERYNAIPVIGLTATPYSKGLGLKYNNLLVPITPRELLAQGYLCPVKYYGGEHVDLSKVRSIDPNTYSPQDLVKATDNNSERLTGCIINNWLEYGENAQTIAFSPSQAHSKYLVERFRAAGITAEHIDCHTPDDERDDLYQAHDRGEFKVLSCSRLLNTGYDSPSTRVIIDCFPTKSITTYVQRIGRITRTDDGKEYGIYLDHASNYERFGYAEDIVPTELHDGSSSYNERELTNKKDKKEPKTSNCPQCSQLMKGVQCVACGYTVPITERMEDDGSMLKEIGGNAANKKDPIELKSQFLSELHSYAVEKGYKTGWAANQYREKYDTWPPKQVSIYPTEVTDLAKGWIKHQNIKRARGKKKGRETLNQLKSEISG